ncbi:MAG: protein TolQ [Gammaproteobacteria bacterium]|nr:protein TolQ [Gammaproteobacteria bacterium]
MFNHWIIKLVSEASLVVQTVMFILLCASFLSWLITWSKREEFGIARKRSDQFEERFYSGTGLSQLYKEYRSQKTEKIGLENIFLAGCKEYSRLRNTFPNQPEVIVDGSRRSMFVALSREIDSLEDKLPVLATIASASPYVGLFGTVWGIMTSFRALGNVQQATLAMVAPGISEALIATALGLFCAIPAVIAYNSFTTAIDRLNTQYSNFIEDVTAHFDRDARLFSNDRHSDLNDSREFTP